MITIVSYQTTWPQEFTEIAARIRSEMGSLALRIDHIGSTSVPGLAAKDRIDIQVTVSDLSVKIEQSLNRTGFVRNEKINEDHIPPGFTDMGSQWKKWLFSPVQPSRPINLHVRIEGNPNQRYPILFRDYLRTHPEAAEAYVRVKKALAHYHSEDIEAYCDIKDPVCDLIIQAAENWASQNGWQPDPSDC